MELNIMIGKQLKYKITNMEQVDQGSWMMKFQKI